MVLVHSLGRAIAEMDPCSTRRVRADARGQVWWRICPLFTITALAGVVPRSRDPLIAPTRLNEIWALDFMHDAR